MQEQRSIPIAETTSNAAPPVQVRSPAQKADATAPAKGQVFRRKIDCGSSTETSAERLVLRDPGHLLRNHRRPHR